MDDATDIGRLALRVEGDMWNAYYARQGTMDGAVRLDSIRMSLVTPARKQAFMDMMKDAVADHIRAITNASPSWRTERAPEHERAGRA